MTGIELESYRKSLGLTQAQFAERVGLNREKTISEYENGRKIIPLWLSKRIELEKKNT